MFCYTQTGLNCWKTSVACVLEIPPSELPEQIGPSYDIILNKWLYKKGLQFVRYPYFPKMNLYGMPRYCFLSGKSVRSVGEYSNRTHMIVGYDGKPIWDPHPTRIG